MTKRRPPPSSASSTFCFSSCRLPTMSCPSTPTTITPRGSLFSEKPMRSLLRLQSGHRRRVHNIVHARPARQVGDRFGEPLQDRADRRPLAQPLYQFVSDVAAVKIGKD